MNQSSTTDKERESLQRMSLEEVQKEEFRLLCEFDRICRENDLTYYLAYGSLLGAIRHGGPIPWDDDTDVLMPYPDYLRLLSLEINDADCVLIPPEGYNYQFEWAKFVSKRTVFEENYSYYFGDYGVYIDVFPLNALMPGKEKQHFSSVRRDRRLKNCGYTRDYNKMPSLPKRIRGRLLGKIVRFKSYEQWCDEILANACRCDFEACKYVINMYTKYSFEREIIPISDLEGYSICTYSGKEFKTFANPIKFLERVYGSNWKTPIRSRTHGAAYWKDGYTS